MFVWLTSAFGVLVVAGSLLLLVPSAVVLAQVTRALRAQRHPRLAAGPDSSQAGVTRPRLAVLIPAHNEELGIEATLASILPQLHAEDRVLVVADNCQDGTARLARCAGADVVERTHATLRGKGYALDHGIRHLAADPPDVVIIVDADCGVEPGALDALARATLAHQRPAQALYLMHASPAASARQRLAAFAWLVRNKVRPLGGLAMGWPCQLMGSGMGFVYAQLQHAPVATGNIVEDMQLGLEFAAEGRAPLHVRGAAVHSHFPSGEQAGQQQRTRWEHGHLATITAAWRQWGVRALSGKTPGLLAMLVDLSVPPLALMVMTQIGALTFAVVGAAAGLLAGPIWAGVLLLTVGLMASTLAVVMAWRSFGRHLLSARELLAMPAYALRKVPLYLGYLVKKQTAWVRTERDAKVGKP